MKKFIYFIILTISFMGLAHQLFAKTYFKAVFMSNEEALKKWGRNEFDPNAFKTNAPKEKSAMAVDLILSKKYVGKSILYEVRRDLGTPDGYFFSDTIIAYEFEPLSKTNKE